MTSLTTRFAAVLVPSSDNEPFSNSEATGSPFYNAVPVNTLTLSANDAPNDDILGILWVPQVISTCGDALDPPIPSKVMNRSESLSTNHAVIGFAPWITSSNCTAAALAEANTKGALAFISYLQDNSTELPSTRDPRWILSYGGQNQGEYQGNTNFPIYAIPGASGAQLMSQLAAFVDSNSLASRPTWIRADIVIEDALHNLPSIWVFLLIVVCCLLLAVALTSLVLNIVQRWHRRSLMRRINRGEVSLEQLGIQRMRVPRDVLDKLPTYAYTKNKAPPKLELVEGEATQTKVPEPGSSSDSPPEDFQPRITTNQILSQPMCAICLEDFDEGQTTVRELPCRHIFHPGCVDGFLLENSSLCPMCKSSVLPAGYIPPVITNAMIRRERMVRTGRARPRLQGTTSTITPSAQIQRANGNSTVNRPAISARARALFARHPTNARTNPSQRQEGFGAAVEANPETNAVSGEQVSSTPLEPIATTVSEGAPAQNRNEWARQRALEMIGDDATVEEEEDQRQANRTPSWRKALRRLFPRVS